ncbi:unnamed protein product [Effrenium voratum]|uniref:Transmembrane protein n=1 Tax=Effrenium voratum TaxID=2562239 RepID=A0AA36I4W5_9DINO|nr:unnamed protein product [Effrenium voratum]CAJ1439611.1 unnamed protein product [Effrenium voratum]
MQKRPAILIEFAKSESKDKCHLSDETAADKEQLGTFLNHFMLVPGYSTEDVHDTDLGLPEHCQEFMQDMWRADVKRTVARVADGEAELEKEPGAVAGNSSLVEVVSDAAEGESFRAEGGDTAETAEVVFILVCIVVCLVCLVFGGGLAALAVASLSGENPSFAAFFVCGVLSGLVFFGAFAMAWPVGVAALVGAIVVGVVFAASSLEKGAKDVKPHQLSALQLAALSS